MDKTVTLESVKADREMIERMLNEIRYMHKKDLRKVMFFEMELFDIAETYFNTGIYDSYSMCSLNKKIKEFIKKRLSDVPPEKYYLEEIVCDDFHSVYYTNFQEDYKKTVKILVGLSVEALVKDDVNLFYFIKNFSIYVLKRIEEIAMFIFLATGAIILIYIIYRNNKITNMISKLFG